MLITKGITNGTFRRYFTESSGTIHFSIALLITVFYRQNHRWIKKPSVLFGGFLKKLNKIKYYGLEHRQIEKSSIIFDNF